MKEPQFVLKTVQQRRDFPNQSALLASQQRAQDADRPQSAPEGNRPPGGLVDQDGFRVQFLGEDDGLGFPRSKGLPECIDRVTILRRSDADKGQAAYGDGCESRPRLLELHNRCRGDDDFLEQGGEEFQTAQMAQCSDRRGVTHDDGQGSHSETVQSCQILCQVLDGRSVDRNLPFQQRVFHAVAVQASQLGCGP